MRNCSIALVMASMIAGASAAQDSKHTAAEIDAYQDAWSRAIEIATPEGYLYEELQRCAGCHETAKDAKGNSTHRNAIGIVGDPRAPQVTGRGWLSGGHGRSQDRAIAANTHCAWCHAPSQPGVTDDISSAEPIDGGRVGVSCIACHASEAVNDEFGSYQANFRPGGDRDSLVDFVPRHPDNGIETNAQCLFCHLRQHEFTIKHHGSMVRNGDLLCIDCHMAVYSVTESGREERYHNMKVAENRDPVTCAPCHHFEPDEMKDRCAELVSVEGSIVHGVPALE